jgi:hypothetical protein
MCSNFVIRSISTVILRFRRKGYLRVLPKNIFTLLKLQNCISGFFKSEFADSLQKWLSFHRNNDFITQIISENVNILTWIYYSDPVWDRVWWKILYHGIYNYESNLPYSARVHEWANETKRSNVATQSPLSL